MMSLKNKKVIIELNEHDALKLLSLIDKEHGQTDKVWHRYWEHLAYQVKQGIERAGFGPDHRLNKTDGPFDRS